MNNIGKVTLGIGVLIAQMKAMQWSAGWLREKITGEKGPDTWAAMGHWVKGEWTEGYYAGSGEWDKYGEIQEKKELKKTILLNMEMYGDVNESVRSFVDEQIT
jgi:hypothetical protein